MKNKLGSTLAAAALLGAAAFLAAAFSSSVAIAAGEPLRLLARTYVPGFEGDFDHFAADTKGNRLFLAGEEKGTLEIFKLTPGADVMSYDASSGSVWIVTGGKNASKKLPDTTVAVVDPVSGKTRGEFKFDTDFTEAIAFEQKGSRAFVNVSGKHYVAVVDKKTHKVLKTWPIKEGQNNAPIGLDEDNKRLFVVTRKPFKFVVLDTDTGATVASMDAPQRTNELVMDRANHRIYLTGDDYIAVIEQKGADKYEQVAKIASDKGAKTAILVPELNRLYVAVAGKGAVKASVLQYEVLPASK